MTAGIQPSPAAARGQPGAVLRAAVTAERWLEILGERLNPILVKETRQALKSKQFVVTFGLVLLVAWLWSFLGLATTSQDIFYGTFGPTLFSGYYLIVSFPLTIIVPFGAFRSLATEQEDLTYELLSITELKPRQVIGGKLASAMVQMLVYLSALAPCLAFTYMLRGIDFPTILFILSCTVLVSLGLSMIGLMVGTLTTEKHWQVVLSVVLIVGLLIACYTVNALTATLLFWGGSPDFLAAETWQVLGIILTAFFSYFALVFFAAVAQITFAADNRSTRLRIVIVAQHLLFLGWMAWFCFAHVPNHEEVLYAVFIVLGFHWYIMGTLMTGEWPELSPRVKRGLPRSYLGRALLTWFNPGPGSGYALSVCGMVGGLLLVGMAATAEAFGLLPTLNWDADETWTAFCFGLAATAYLVIYLGVGLLLVRALRRYLPLGTFLGVIVQVVLLMIGIVVPLIGQRVLMPLVWNEFTLLQLPDPFWTLAHLIDGPGLPTDAFVVIALLIVTAGIVFLANLPGIAHEVRNVRIAQPKRVAQEDAQLAAELAPPKPTQTSPWDEA